MAVKTRAEITIDDVHRYSLEEYHRLIEAGGFDDERVELLDGFLVVMSPKTPEHELALRWLTDWLYRSVDLAAYQVGVGSPLTLASSEPEPDLIVFERSTPAPYHPATAALAIEVAVSSLRRDLRLKAALYAAAGVTEYWVVDLDAGRVVVHRDPTPDGYGKVTEVTQTLTPSSVALGAVDLGELFRAVADR